MRHAQAVLPYLAASLLIAGVSTALVFATVRDDDASAPSTASDVARGAPPLSATGRLAYWRQNPAGAFVLYAANFDGSGPRPLHTLSSSASRPFGTRWTGDGTAVAFVSDLGITAIALDGARTDFILPLAVRSAGYRVIDQRWSPSGERVAATVYRSTDARSDVYLASRDKRDLVKVGDLGNAFAADWLGDEEVLVESDRGQLWVARHSGALRKLVDQPAGSPFVDGGRVYFLAGAVTTNGDGSGIFVSSPAVWSVAASGADARREDRLGISADLKLDGRWPDGRYLMHVVRDRMQRLATPGARLEPLSSQSVLQRVVVSSDRRSAIGFGIGRVVRIDLSRGFAPAEGAFVVLLDGILAADAWVMRGALP